MAKNIITDKDDFEDAVEHVTHRSDDVIGRHNGVPDQSEAMSEQGHHVEEYLEEQQRRSSDSKGHTVDHVNGPVENREEILEHHRHTEDESLPRADLRLEDAETAEDDRDVSPEGDPDPGDAEDEEDRTVISPGRGGLAAEDSAEEQMAESVHIEERLASPKADFNAEPEVDEGREVGEEKLDQTAFEESPPQMIEVIHVEQQSSAPVEEKEEKPAGLDSEIYDIFKLFDYDMNETIDSKDLGNVLRCMQLNPTEGDVKVLTNEFISDNSKIAWSDFLPKVMEIIENEKFKPASEDELITAFSLLDTDKKGFLTVEQLRSALLKLGEPLNEEEFEDMLSAASDFDSDCFNYVEYAKLLVCN